jgi:endonuclease III related protein
VKSDSRHELRRQLVRRWYERLLASAGPRGWWPGDGRDEIITGAVLTQNTAWKNVEKALANLRAVGMLRLDRLATADPADIAPLIRPSGYFNLKARRLHSVAAFFAPGGRERFDELALLETGELRDRLLGVWGIGPETVDCILLYALGRPSFVIDAYTLRVVRRHGLAPAGTNYEHARSLFTKFVEPDAAVYNEFHALLVWVGHHFCKPTPRCADCPLSVRDCFATEKAWKALKSARAAGAPGSQ